MCWHLPMVSSYWQVKAGESEVQAILEIKSPQSPRLQAKAVQSPSQFHRDTCWAELDQDSPQGWGRMLVAATVANKVPVPGSSGQEQNQPPGHLMPSSMTQGQGLYPVYTKVLWFLPETFLDELEKLVENQKADHGPGSLSSWWTLNSHCLVNVRPIVTGSDKC